MNNTRPKVSKYGYTKFGYLNPTDYENMNQH